MIKKFGGKRLSWLSKGVLAIVITAACFQMPSEALAISNDKVRVALFLNFGSTYKSTVPAVTLQSENIWSVGDNGIDGYQSWISFAANKQVRFSIDQFRVKVLETSDWKIASDASQKLSGTSDKPMLFSISQNGKSVYQLYSGVYASEQEANEATSRVAKTVVAQLNGQTPTVKGNHYLSAGMYKTESQAELQRAKFTNAGLEASIAILPTESYSYAVWVGEAVNINELTAIKSQANELLPKITLRDIELTIPALIKHQDVGLDLKTEQAVDHYQISGPSTKLWIPENEAGTKVVERSQRSYRGAFEISSYNGQMSLVNEVPIEQYLYSVVGGEVPSSWAEEALKTQAVAARSYAKFQNNKFKIADVVDTTLSQVYNGISSEAPSITKAVDATRGEVLMKNGKVVEAIFSSNSGGVTADSSEVWNSVNDTFASVASEEDISAQKNMKMWYYVLLNNGVTGYVREDNVNELASKTQSGLGQLTVTAKDTNVRPIPLIQSSVSAVSKLNPGDTATILDKVTESNSYSWVRGPYTSDELLKSMKGKTTTKLPSTINTLEVTKRGPSGRAIEIQVNGQVLEVKYADMFRSALNGLPSTLFDIVPIESYNVLASDGIKMNTSQKFMFVGRGNGHGLGLSQWGAKGMADAGSNYQDILRHYYQNVTIVKE
ncbi:stage II sporulation protein D [Paenibacillus sp. DS2015]|uniref:SpoIID/LytB domain-containing protein n=1 Tax=Paenibacillus sp. DS2015 TaxID=3373917 RepID=UPI003D257A97